MLCRFPCRKAIAAVAAKCFLASTTANVSGDRKQSYATDSGPAQPPATIGRPQVPMKKAKNSFLECIEKEIDDETLRVDKVEPNIPPEWTLSHEEGSSIFSMTRNWRNEIHTVRCRFVPRDPSQDPECDLRGEHIPFSFIIERPPLAPVIDFTLDVVEGELIVNDMRTYESSHLAKDGSIHGDWARSMLFAGPELDEVSEEVLQGLQDYLAEREVDDQFGELIGHVSIYVEQQEYERWLFQLKSWVEA